MGIFNLKISKRKIYNINGFQNNYIYFIWHFFYFLKRFILLREFF